MHAMQSLSSNDKWSYIFLETNLLPNSVKISQNSDGFHFKLVYEARKWGGQGGKRKGDACKGESSDEIQRKIRQTTMQSGANVNIFLKIC